MGFVYLFLIVEQRFFKLLFIRFSSFSGKAVVPATFFLCVTPGDYETLQPFFEVDCPLIEGSIYSLPDCLSHFFPHTL